MAARKRKKRGARQSSNVGCLIVLSGLVVLAIVFVIKFPDIKAAFERTDFLKLVKEKASTTTIRQKDETVSALPAAKPEPAKPSSPATSSTLAPLGAPKAAPRGAPVPAPSTTIPAAAPASPSQTPSAAAPSAAPAGAKPGGVTATTLAPKPSVPTRQASLFFIKIADDGVISRHEVKRNVPVSDSPLSDAIRALIAGPSEGEIRSGLVSLIPRGTKLLGITLRGSTAIIDLSEAFMYNHYGVEGYSAQLRQIVYTATSFSSVQDVQILVEGRQKDYLGGEGVFIGNPLSRNSF